MANIDAALEEQILDVAQRQWVSDEHHHYKPDNFG
jgi:hypothetical protein